MSLLHAPAGAPPSNVTETLLDSYWPIESLSLKSVPVPGSAQAGLGLGEQDAALLITFLDEQSSLRNNAGAPPSWAAKAQHNLLPADKKLSR